MNAQIVTEARTWLGVRWEHQGRTRTGVDCAGLVIKTAHALGLTTFDTADYERQAKDETMLALFSEHLDAIDIIHAEPGDVVVMRFDNQRHAGILGEYIYGGLSLIHAYSMSRKVVEHRLDEVWQARIIGAFRFRGVA